MEEKRGKRRGKMRKEKVRKEEKERIDENIRLQAKRKGAEMEKKEDEEERGSKYEQ